MIVGRGCCPPHRTEREEREGEGERKEKVTRNGEKETTSDEK